MDKENFRIVFMGTPEFAVESLKALVEKNFHIAGVVTNPDKPAGRGQKIAESAVKKYAKKKGLPVIQPKNIKDPDFIVQLKNLNPDLQVVVAFKILPPEVFNIPKYGTFNLHASLLPDYRGAAPINHAIINGETLTGVTTFFLDEHVDTGQIIDKKEVEIHHNDTAGSLHDKLMVAGGKLVIETVDKIINQNYQVIDQNELIQSKTIKKAPKIFKEDCRINWKKPASEVHNFIRGLSPYPAAWTELKNQENKLSVKIFLSEPENTDHKKTPGEIITDENTYIKVACKGGFINIYEVQVAGKKKMKTHDFLKGFRNMGQHHFE